ncbi:DUF3772 domain-containing protein [Aestuariibius sp. HNIBRBA575]|uniref:DUF3772 domain-containing protein n=1 Tax=Aestuariibius sp. HNIBRBA575 TaxID=3233343 RepID=UPI0034A4BDDA
MIRFALLIAVFWTALTGAVHAQDEPDYDAWSTLAIRAEMALEAGRASDYIFEDMRAEIALWRDIFANADGAQADRLATIQAQLDALSALPDTELPEDERITARRIFLEDQQARLQAPVSLASEAYARANGLIGEIDILFRTRQLDARTKRGPTPLNPANWGAGATQIPAALRQLNSEFTNKINADVWQQNAGSVLPVAGLLSLLGFVLVLRGQRWTLRLQRGATAVTRRGKGVARFVVSLGQILLPAIGLMLLFAGIIYANVLDFRGVAFAESIFSGALVVVLARWLAYHFCPVGPELSGPLSLTEVARKQGRLLVIALGWVLALRDIGMGLFQLTSATAEGESVLTFLLHVFAAFLLFRLGGLLAPTLEEDQDVHDATSFRQRLTRVVGRSIQIVAVVAPLISAAGYISGASLILYATIMSLGLFGIVGLLMVLVFDVYALALGNDPENNTTALTPVLISFGLAFFAMPVLMLIWGARVSDLTEVWAWFREGFSLGDTKISPTDFLTFLLVFAAGYVLTRLIQSALKSTILPRTKLDLGGRNAIVSGVGYIGIFIASLVAITMAGIDLSNIALVAGALSVGIGFGLQNIVSNFVSGIILLIERPISQGDWIEVGSQMGYVRDISVRSTRIETFDRTDVIVPNSDLVSGLVTNWTRGNSVGRVIVPVGVAYGTDTDRVAQILQEIAESHPMVLLNPAPSVVFQGFGADSLDFEIRAILRDVNWVLSVKSEMNHAIARRFTEENIEIPFAQRDIWLRNPEALSPKTAPPANSAAPETSQIDDHNDADPDAQGDKP